MAFCIGTLNQLHRMIKRFSMSPLSKITLASICYDLYTLYWYFDSLSYRFHYIFITYGEDRPNKRMP